MRSVEVVEALPFIEFSLQIDVPFVAEQLIKFLLIRAVRSFHFATQLRGTALDVGMTNTEVLDMPVELGLELVTVVGSDFAYPERELVNDMIDEVDRIGLCMFFIDFQGANAGRIIDRRILETAYLLALFSNKSQELDVHLDMVTRD